MATKGTPAVKKSTEVAEVDEALDTIKELRIENDKLRRKKTKLKNKIKVLKSKIE